VPGELDTKVAEIFLKSNGIKNRQTYKKAD